MIRVLIVDDEPLVLLTIKTLCRWEDFGITISGEAANGKGALDYIREHPDTDIVIVDVDMPVMNGIQFAQALRQEQCSSALIFLSSYSNFEYVRSAFKSGACEYMLKSEMDERSLTEAIHRIAKDSGKPDGNPRNDASPEMRPAFFEAVLGQGGPSAAEDVESLFRQSAFSLDWPLYFSIIRPGDLLMVHQRYENRLYDFQKTVEDMLRRFAVKFSGDCGSLSYDQYYIFMKSAEELETVFEMFYRAAWTYIDTGFEKKSGGPAAGAVDFQEQFSRCLAGFLPPSRLVIRSRRYIREHYSDSSLSLLDIASYNGVSKNYLSFEFARETGETISDFLTRVRIKEAEKLIMETNLKMYEIAEKTGYVNVETFSRAFKRIIGKSPSRLVGAKTLPPNAGNPAASYPA